MRKKLFTFLLALVTSVGLMNAAVDDSGSCGDNVTYSFNGTTGEMVINGTGPMTVYTSGSSLLPWKDYKDAITSVVVEDGVTSVSQYSFGQCTNLTTVVIGNDVEAIGQFAFNDCGTSFTSLTLGSSLKSVGMAAFLNAKGITTLTLPDGFETVGDYAFCRLEALQTLNIPSSVTSIGASAFFRCYPLATINCAAVTPPSLGDDAFGDIANKSNIPLYVPSGSVAAYEAAAQWTDFDIQGYDPAPTPANVCGDGLTWELNGGVLTISYDGVGTGVMNDFEQDSSPWKDQIASITSVVINEGAKNIGKHAFYECEHITTVTLANSVETIGEGAFRNCEDLASLELGNNIKTIEQEAFITCSALKTVTIGTGITSIGTGAFYGCEELTTVTCSATTPPILGMAVFESCPKLEHIYVPAESVDDYKTAWSNYENIIVAIGGDPQPVVNLKLIEFQVPASWENDNTPISSADFPDFVATTYEIASALPVTSDEPSLVVFDFPGDDEVSVYTKVGGQVSKSSTGAIKREVFFENTQVHYYYPVLDDPEPEPTPTVWTALAVGDVIKLGDKIEVPAEGDGSWGINGNVLRNAWGPYTLILADIYQASEFDDPVVTETEDGAFYVFKAENSDFYPLSNLGKGTGLVVTTTSDGLVVTAAESKEFTVAVHDNGGTPTGVENVQTNQVQTTKILRDGQLYIMYKGTIYNVQGARVK